MGDRPVERLGQVFPRLDVWAAPARLQLSELLAIPTSVPALLAREIADLPCRRLSATTSVGPCASPSRRASGPRR